MVSKIASGGGGLRTSPPSHPSKLKFCGDIFNLSPEMERIVSIASWAGNPLWKETFTHPVSRQDQQRACKQMPSRFSRG